MTITINVRVNIADKLVERDGRRSFIDLVDDTLDDNLADLEEELARGVDPDDVEVIWEMSWT